MSNEAPVIVQKLWNFCNILRDDGVSYGDYVQQLTNLLFLKMADEQTNPPFKKKSIIPKKYDWTTITSKTGDELESHYRHVLENLAKESGLLGVIFRKSQNKIQDPAKLERLIRLIDGDSKTRFFGVEWILMLKVKYTRDCWRKMQKMSKAVLVNTLRHVH